MTAVLERMAREPRPAALSRFERVQRFWDPATEHWTAKILPGEYYVTCNQESVATVLGSCVAACLRDTETGIGGMNHFMLPEDRSGGVGNWSVSGSRSTRFGSYAMESLLNDLFKLGARRERLELKLFGGARILQSGGEVGANNVAFVRSFAAVEGLRVVAEDMGGVVPRHVLYFPATGRVLLKRLRSVLDPVVAERENAYRAALAAQSYETDVELFE